MLHDAFWSRERRATFAFCDARSTELFGSMALGEVDFTARSAVAGYWAAPWARHRGATREGGTKGGLRPCRDGPELCAPEGS